MKHSQLRLPDGWLRHCLGDLLDTRCAGRLPACPPDILLLDTITCDARATSQPPPVTELQLATVLSTPTNTSPLAFALSIASLGQESSVPHAVTIVQRRTLLPGGAPRHLRLPPL